MKLLKNSTMLFVTTCLAFSYEFSRLGIVKSFRQGNAGHCSSQVLSGHFLMTSQQHDLRLAIVTEYRCEGVHLLALDLAEPNRGTSTVE